MHTHPVLSTATHREDGRYVRHEYAAHPDQYLSYLAPDLALVALIRRTDPFQAYAKRPAPRGWDVAYLDT